MKKTLLALLIIPFIFLESCKNDFSINASKKDFYILNCILRNDNSFQYAVISKNIYTESGAPPASNNNGQYIKNASVKIFFNDSVFVMSDTTLQITDSGNITQVDCYYLKKAIISPGKAISIEATIPDGTILKSEIQQVPLVTCQQLQVRFPPTTTSGYQKDFYFSWSVVGSKIVVFALPQLIVYYQKYEGGMFVDKISSISLSQNFTYLTTCETSLAAINKMMQDISGNDPNKNYYIINKVIFSVTCLDPELAKYYSVYNTFAEDFTVKLRQTDYSNIDGGKGIFGSCNKFFKSLSVDSLYVKSFGYQFAPPPSINTVFP